MRDRCREQLARPAEQPPEDITFRSAVEHYLTTYGRPELPPSWVTLELLTFGELIHLVRNLAEREDRNAIAQVLGVNEPLLISWLWSYQRVRNICAHHGRLWNVGLGVYPALPRSRRVAWLDRPEVLNRDQRRAKRLYPVMVSIQSVLTTISPRSTWASRLAALLDENPSVPLDGMGFPHDWSTDSFWSRHLADPQ